MTQLRKTSEDLRLTGHFASVGWKRHWCEDQCQIEQILCERQADQLAQCGVSPEMINTSAVTDDGEVECPWDSGQVQGLSPPVIAACRDRETEKIGVQLLLGQPTQEIDPENRSIVSEQTARCKTAPMLGEEGVGLAGIREGAVAREDEREYAKSGEDFNVLVTGFGTAAYTC